MPKESSTNQRNQRWLHAACPFSVTLSALGSRWRAPILWKLLGGDRTFGDLTRSLPLVSEKMLAQSLGELQELGLIDKQSDEGPPLRVVYAPTELGATLRPLLSALQEWGVRHQRPPLVPDVESSAEPWEPEPGRWSADHRDEGA